MDIPKSESLKRCLSRRVDPQGEPRNLFEVQQSEGLVKLRDESTKTVEINASKLADLANLKQFYSQFGQEATRPLPEATPVDQSQ
jgi:hypothetical protein